MYPKRTYSDSKDDKQKLTNFLQGYETKKILLAFEVARRKHEQDPYRDLPVLCAISMALYLIEQQCLPEKDFWAQDGKYYMFSGVQKDREIAVKEIIKLFLHKSREEGVGSEAFKNTILDLVNRAITKLMQEQM